jgi:hypothetical protein
MNEDYKVFTTLKDEVTFHYPEYWMHEIENERTYLFYEEFLGSFRVTPRTMDPELFEISEYLFSEFQKKEEFDPEWKDLGGKEFLYYEGDWQDRNKVYRIHHYIGGYKNILVTCSFAYDTALFKDPIGSEEIKKEIAGAERVLVSMRFKGEPKKKVAAKKK